MLEKELFTFANGEGQTPIARKPNGSRWSA